MEKKLQIEEILKRIKFLKPISGATAKVIQALDNPESSAEDIKDAILLDPALTADVLRIVNSAYFALRQRVANVKHAVALLGRKTIKKIIFTARAGTLLKRNLEGYPTQENANTLWEHSLVTAVSAEIIAEKLQYKDKELAYIGGLLHDIGKIILDQYVKDVTQKVEAELAKGKELTQIEKELFGYDHAELGGIMAENWQLPLPIKEAIAYHHSPTEASKEVMIAFIAYMANNLANFICPLGNYHTQSTDPAVLQHIGLNDADMEEITLKIIAKKEEILTIA
ncbi:MAG: HDOD domain-containing protein [Candidatus Desulfofervidaceae bacterium]|nr:HDOD domain-containing protein [Candidatus Desulfofervidaceae bacterium]